MKAIPINKIEKRTKNFREGMELCVKFLAKNQGLSFLSKELAKEYKLSEQTILASMGKEARKQGYELHYSRSNNYGQTLVWLIKIPTIKGDKQ